MTKHTPGPWVFDGLNSITTKDGFLLPLVGVTTPMHGGPLKDEARANAKLIAAAPDLLDALKKVTQLAERNICQHDKTHRGGAVWEICDMCGAKWADDEGGKPDYKEPPEITAAYDAIRKATS